MYKKLLIAFVLSFCWSGVIAQTVSTGIPVAKDVNGEVLGPIIDFVESPALESVTAVLFVSGQPVFIGVSPEGGVFDRGFFFTPLYTGLGCTGTLYLGESTGANFNTAITVNSVTEDSSGNLTAYIAQANAPVETGLTIQSFVRSDGVCIDGGGPTNTTEAIPADQHTTPFVSPLTIEQGPTVAQAGFALAVPNLSASAKWLLLATVILMGIGALRRQG